MDINEGTFRRTVLVVEDELVNSQLLGYILSEEYNVLYAEDGEKALAVLKENKGHISMVLTDIKMPVMDGLEATKKIKASHPDLPIIAVTANAFDSDRQLAFDAGCDDFLSKPISSEACLSTIKKIIGE